MTMNTTAATTPAAATAAQSKPATPYLDFDGVADVVEELGFPRPERVTVIGWADRKVLPFFKGLDGKRYIARQTVVEFFRKKQAEATDPAGGRRRGGRRS